MHLNRNFSWLLVVFVIALLPRVSNLDQMLSPDEPQWELNVIGFKEAIETGDFKGFYQQPHPGITTQWVSFLTIDSDSWGIKRFPLAITITALIVIASYFVTRLWGLWAGTIAGVLLALNPLLIGHARVLAMDALLAMFLLLSVLALLVWLDRRQRIFLMLSGITAALAILSKMAGAVIVPFIGVIVLVQLWRKKISVPEVGKAAGIWLLSFTAAAVIVFPTLLTHWPTVWEGTQQFFSTEHYQQAVHALGPWWYPQALLLWSTPLQLLALGGIVSWHYIPKKMRGDLLVVLAFAIVFFLAMQYSIKKGDRYILPVFVALDVFAAGIIGGLIPQRARLIPKISLGVMALAVIWQVVTVASLHPYTLAYRNPLFRQVAVGRTMGWGEGLDVAAEYINQKPNSEELLVISYYESSFALHFKGEVTSAERLAKETPEEIGGDYVVLYRTMEGRAPDRWETKVLADFANKTPEHVISLNGEEYVWIYPVAGEQ